MIPGLIISAIVILIIAVLFVRCKIRNAERNRLLSLPLSAEAEKIIEKNVKLYNYLPEQLKKHLQGLVNVFIAEKRFEACQGLQLTDEIKITIAAQACMLLLNRTSKYFPKLKTILVYPHTYVAKNVSTRGRIQIQGKSVRLGESWLRGPVVLAWDSVKAGAVNIRDGRNVVLHEFSHQLDQEDGAADGAPILENRSCYTTWAHVMCAEYKTLRKKAKKFNRSVMNRYGATNPAEFFAVATETFFEKPKQMKKKHNELYLQLKDYYKLDPVEWLKNKN